MNNLSNERLKAIADLGSPECMALPPSHDQCAAMARELLAYREAQGKAVAEIYAAPERDDGYRLAMKKLEPAYDLQKGVHKLYAAPQLPAVSDGWTLVPIEPTRQMMSQGHFAMKGTDRGKFRRIYQAMIAAAPKPSSET